MRSHLRTEKTDRTLYRLHGGRASGEGWGWAACANSGPHKWEVCELEHSWPLGMLLIALQIKYCSRYSVWVVLACCSCAPCWLSGGPANHRTVITPIAAPAVRRRQGCHGSTTVYRAEWTVWTSRDRMHLLYWVYYIVWVVDWLWSLRDQCTQQESFF